MLMVIDIGNTNITLGIYQENMLKCTFRLMTKTPRTSDEYGATICSFLFASQIKTDEIEDVIIASVVPKIMHSFTNSIRKYLHHEPLIISPGIKTGISIQTDSPKAVGADRIVDLAGCYYNYGGNALVIDFGTATTFDYISKDGVFQYGVTSPGIQISADALWTRLAEPGNRNQETGYDSSEKHDYLNAGRIGLRIHWTGRIHHQTNEKRTAATRYESNRNRRLGKNHLPTYGFNRYLRSGSNLQRAI